MTLPDWHEEPIAKEHDRDSFECGDRDLNDYLNKFARQNHERGGAKTFLAINDAGGRVLGFYSLAPAVAEFDQVPAGVRKGLPRHDVRGYRLARLATDKTVAGHGLGGELLLAAGKRALQVAAKVGGVALYIDAKSERTAAWYKIFGVEPLTGASEGRSISMAISLKTIEAALKAAGKS